tara:strand:+ start:170 stop:460 length:291 start_codon:yes stop_codon:yes gene_type:complete
VQWLFYILLSTCFILLFKSIFKVKLIFPLFIIFIILITPAQIESGSQNYAPSVFTFFFNLLFERDYSLKPLRPIAISLPACTVIYWSFTLVKRRFF